ncbi:MAG: serine/threonine protein kinase, partial [Verrucomicrobiales bacterium]
MNDRQIYMNAPEGASPEELARYLDAACGRNNGLRLQVESLFEAEKRAGSAFMEVSPLDGQRRGSELSSLPRSTLLDLGGGERVEGDKMEVGSSLPTTIVLAESPGAIIGNYKLRKKIGEGGFGVVFEAEQLWPLKRRVALKIIRIGMDTGPVVARFKLERQALALMDHPSIAKVYDAGVAESGRPFFVMELVRGVPINDYCDGRNLTTPERLELFIEVCMAVQHAHLKGVIHRDLKPSNILVTEVNDVPTPKIIDFGIAKATQATLTDGTLVTAASEVVGTPEYMSPEQAGSAGFDVDTRCDVYSLGATLYQLITGVPPIKLRGEKIGVEEMFRRVREEVPALPSIRIATAMGEAAAQKQGEKIGPDASALLRRISRDLDWIILKALEKQRQRRYQRPEDLAADLRAYLTNRPVSARAPSVLYRTGKLVQRHRSAFQLAAVCFVIVALSMVIFARARSQDQAENTASLYLQSGSEHARELLPEIQLDRPAIRRLMEEAPGARGKLAIAKFETLAWEEIEPSLWTASTDELPLFLDVAVAKPSVSVDAWEILADVTARRATRLNAAAALARFAPQDQRWNGLATQVASLLVFEKSGSIAEWIDLLQPVQSWLREPLADLVADAEPAQFGTLATALA